MHLMHIGISLSYKYVSCQFKSLGIVWVVYSNHENGGKQPKIVVGKLYALEYHTTTYSA